MLVADVHKGVRGVSHMQTIANKRRGRKRGILWTFFMDDP